MRRKRRRVLILCILFIVIVIVTMVAVIAEIAPSVARTNPGSGTGKLAGDVSVTSDSDSSSHCVLTSTGKVDCWGYNAYGDLGNGTTANSDVPVAATGISDANGLAVTAGGWSTCALLSTGGVKCWGYNAYGELGNGTTTSSDVPVPVEKIKTASAIVGEHYGFCAVLSSKRVSCWGNGSDGALGNGSTSNSAVPVAVKMIKNATKLTSSYNDMCALLSTGHVDCWGYNGYGELGNRGTTNSDVPVSAVGITNAEMLESDPYDNSFCAVLSTGKVDCWGYNGDGELGNGSTTNSDVPVAVTGISDAKAIAEDSDNGDGAGSFCSLLSTKKLSCWGYGSDGDLGDGRTKSSDVPVAVNNITAATAVIGGDYGFCSMLSNNHLDCWGYGGYGDLGNGTSANSDIPVAVKRITNASELISGYYSFCSLLSTKQVSCWGYGSAGELGDGSMANSAVPLALGVPS
jgi:alpha-tubulin suppressor-like RCC1 family protein